MDYGLTVKAARLTATQKMLDGAVLQLLCGDDVCASIELSRPCAVVVGDMMAFVGFPKFGQAQVAGLLTSGRIMGRDGATLVRGLTIGGKDSTADIKLEKTLIDYKNLIRITSMDFQHA